MRLLALTTLLLALAASPRAAGAQDAPPFTLQQVVSLLEGGWTGADILEMVSTPCISFRVGPQATAALQGAGADDAFLTGLRQTCVRDAQPGPERASQRSAPRGIVTIEGELPPGWYRTVNNLPMSTNRTIDLTPGRTALIVVAAPGWCPVRTEVTLQAGDEHRWTPELRARPWVGGCP